MAEARAEAAAAGDVSSCGGDAHRVPVSRGLHGQSVVVFRQEACGDCEAWSSAPSASEVECPRAAGPCLLRRSPCSSRRWRIEDQRPRARTCTPQGSWIHRILVSEEYSKAVEIRMSLTSGSAMGLSWALVGSSVPYDAGVHVRPLVPCSIPLDRDSVLSAVIQLEGGEWGALGIE